MNVDSCGSEQVEEGGVGNFVAAGEAGQRGGGHFTSLGCVGARDSVCVGARGDEEVRRSSSVVRVCVCELATWGVTTTIFWRKRHGTSRGRGSCCSEEGVRCGGLRGRCDVGTWHEFALLWWR